ncbi:biopolymer transporter ExbB [Profundibacterium mesophilum]|uniref:Biopolymer transporter ExbB n=1 Tax=Profundibacterium mesophilum KAUST100406-0324 TaxID=1037889 RepID=A0A921P0E7_9RHOB|nr:biopolymer transporter ExbB [Profundibacterium mesophilum]KAF0676898.1 hypothetical protein PMES_00694 [Profundibacterium mesophilum KAUST100406-0324]
MRDRSDRKAEPYFSQPVRQIITMIMVLLLVAVGAYIAFPSVAPVFLANPWLNGFIAFVFVIGVLACFWQELQLIQSVNWIEGFAAEVPGHDMVKAPRLLAPLAALLRSRGRQRHISASSSRSILDSVATRIDEARDITRYIVSLLIFLGLLGTFYGLATTVPAIVDTIRALTPSEGEDGMAIFGRLMSGLERQLGGMGVAFASSLLGLAGSLVVGLLELFASHGQNRFYRELEEWLSSITRLGFAGAEGEGEGTGEGGLSLALVEHMSAQIDRLHELIATSEAGRARVDAELGAVAGALGTLGETLARGREDDALSRIADGQQRLVALLQDRVPDTEGGLDGESRMHLRSIDTAVLRLLEEQAAGRQETVAELRQELRQVVRAVRSGGRPEIPAAGLTGRRS